MDSPSVPATGGPPRVCPWEQATISDPGRAAFAANPRTGAGHVVVAHSDGGEPALVAAAEPGGDAFVGFDVSRHGHRFAVGLPRLPGVHGHGERRRHWRRCGSTSPARASRAGSWWRRFPGRKRRRGRCGLTCIPASRTCAYSRPLHLRRAGAVVAARRRGHGGPDEPAVGGAPILPPQPPAFLEECLLTRDAAVQASGARPGAPVTELACQSAVR
uniref:LanU n=1 Tax=Streptomyces cyanogenus TaxID=80860 RepID=Q9ZGC2_STRCY|nr:LanU [Streptomyces cyanogenus]